MPFKDPEKRKAYRQRPDVKEKKRKYMKAYRQQPEVKEKKRKYDQQPEVKERERKYQQVYQQRPEVKEKRKKYQQVYQQRPEVKEKKRNYQQRPDVKKHRLYQRKHNPVCKRRVCLRYKVNLSVIHQRCYISTIHKLIGCDVPTARAHLEAQFEEWMTWENYGSGKGKWCIDHIIPVASIDIFNEDEVKRIFHYTNMQPLEFCKNCEKGKT